MAVKYRAGFAIHWPGKLRIIKEKGVLHCQLLKRTVLSNLLERETYPDRWPGTHPREDNDRRVPLHMVPLSISVHSVSLWMPAVASLIQCPVPYNVQSQFPHSALTQTQEIKLQNQPYDGNHGHRDTWWDDSSDHLNLRLWSSPSMGYAQSQYWY